MNVEQELQVTIRDLVQKGKGILAADESPLTIAKRFKAVGVESTDENQRAYRSLLLTAPGVGEYLSGVILFEETLGHRAPSPMKCRSAAYLPELRDQPSRVLDYARELLLHVRQDRARL